MTTTPPVQDWASDFDVLDPDYVADPFPIWDELRPRCPIPHTNRRVSSWLPLRYEDVTAIAHDIEHFSSRKIAVIPITGEEGSSPIPCCPTVCRPSPRTRRCTRGHAGCSSMFSTDGSSPTSR